MFSRRTFLSFVAGSMAAPQWSVAQPASQKVALYANVGAELTHYDVDVAGAALLKRETVMLPASVQYAWPHVSRRSLYVATSSSAPGSAPAGTEHHVTAFRIDPASGALTPHGAPIREQGDAGGYAATEISSTSRSMSGYQRLKMAPNSPLSVRTRVCNNK